MFCAVNVCDAFHARFDSLPKIPPKARQRSSSPLSLSTTSTNENKTVSSEEDCAPNHPHSKIWNDAVRNSPESFISPSIQLSIRDPSDGGTGIVAAEDIPADTVLMSLNLQEVGVIDASLLLCDPDGRIDKENDTVMKMLREMWKKELSPSPNSTTENTQEGKRLAVLAGLIAHLQLTRYKDMMNPSSDDSESVSLAVEQSRRLGSFLDAMPLLPQHEAAKFAHQSRHPFPTHFLYWTDDEVQVLLEGTVAQTKAREIRAGTGLVLRGWSESFLKEHSAAVTQTKILNAIFSAFTSVLSRSFGDAAGRDLDGNGRMLVPLVDMLNHDGEDPNVSWKWHVTEEEEMELRKSNDDGKNWETKGDIVVTSIDEIKKGDELFKCYGWRPAWDIASSYGFVPRIKKEQWECAAIPLFPAVFDIGSSTGYSTSNDRNDDSLLDLLLETNYGPLVKAVDAAVEAANEIKARQNKSDNEQNISISKSDRPDILCRFEIVSVFRPPPAHTASDFPFTRRQPCLIVGTKLQSDDSTTTACGSNDYHKAAVDNALPAFRAAASALQQLRDNRSQSGGNTPSPVQASKMAIAAASLDSTKDWEQSALELMAGGVRDRIQTLLGASNEANAWLSANPVEDTKDNLHRQLRAGMASDVRSSELNVLLSLQEIVSVKRSN